MIEHWRERDIFTPKIHTFKLQCSHQTLLVLFSESCCHSKFSDLQTHSWTPKVSLWYTGTALQDHKWSKWQRIYTRCSQRFSTIRENRRRAFDLCQARRTGQNSIQWCEETQACDGFGCKFWWIWNRNNSMSPLLSKPLIMFHVSQRTLAAHNLYNGDV